MMRITTIALAFLVLPVFCTSCSSTSSQRMREEAPQLTDGEHSSLTSSGPATAKPGLVYTPWNIPLSSFTVTPRASNGYDHGGDFRQYHYFFLDHDLGSGDPRYQRGTYSMRADSLGTELRPPQTEKAEQKNARSKPEAGAPSEPKPADKPPTSK
jgi:hypothetical protein